MGLRFPVASFNFSFHCSDIEINLPSAQMVHETFIGIEVYTMKLYDFINFYQLFRLSLLNDFHSFLLSKLEVKKKMFHKVVIESFLTCEPFNGYYLKKSLFKRHEKTSQQ